MRKNRKITCAIIVILIIFTAISQVYAATCPTCKGTGEHPNNKAYKCFTCKGEGIVKKTTGDVIEGAEGFIEEGEKKADEKITSENLINLSNTLHNILLVVGIVIAIIVGLILGIKFILGSLEEKAEIKTMVIPYIVGCVVVFGAFTIWKIIVDLLQQI